jgi:hypothetical protein
MECGSIDTNPDRSVVEGLSPKGSLIADGKCA